jgi:sugar/nucleoside kinase (ribokinase family)
LSSVTVIGCVNVDLLLAPLSEVPLPGTAAFVDRMDLRVGGAGANAALALQEAGTPPRLVGAVGDDHHGRWVLDQLADFGLSEDIVVDAEHATGLTVAVEAPGRDRSFITFLGVTGTAGTEIVPPSSLAVEHVLVCDYFCAPAMRGEPTGHVLQTARELGARTYFDTAWDTDGFSAATREEVHALLPLVDVFLPNEAEARALARTDSVAEAGAELQRRSGGWVVVKLGADGCMAFGPHGGRLSCPAPAIEPADTTGAGDAFNAGLVSAFASGRGWPEALAAATGLASSLLARPSNDRHTVRR